MILTEIAVRRPITTFMLTVAAVVFGAVAFSRLPLNLLPDISYPSLTVEVDYPEAAPSEVENLVTKPVEEAVGVTPGVRRMRSVSSAGRSQVTLEFSWGTSMDFAILEVRKKLDLIRLPDGVQRPRVLRFDPSLDPVMRLVVSGGQDLMSLRRLADEVLKKELESLEGVAAAKVQGGLEEEIQIEADDRKLAAFGLRMEDVTRRLREENVNTAGGSLYEWEARYLVRTVSEFRDVEQIADLSLLDAGGRRVRLRDVAEVRRGFKERQVIARLNGQECVEIALYKEGDANTVQVARRVRALLKNFREKMPGGTTLEIGADQAGFIESSINDVISSAATGGLIAIALLYLFLRRMSLTLLVGLSIPVSVVLTFFLMYQTGLSLNIMTLGGIALGVGMLVDNSIVVLESISRHLSDGKPSVEAALTGSAEVGRAVMASTLTTVAVFLPIVFVEGVAGQLFRDQALTVTYALAASLVMALTLLPTVVAKSWRRGMRWHEDAEPLTPAPRRDPGPQPIRAAGQSARSFAWASIKWFFKRMGFIAAGLSWQGLVAGPAKGWGRLRAAALRAGEKGGRISTPALERFQSLYERLEARYLKLLDSALANRSRVLWASLLCLLAAWGGFLFLGGTLVPLMAQGQFSVRLQMPDGAPLESTDAVARNLQAVLSERPEVAMVFGAAGQQESETYTGTSSAEHLGQVNVRMRNASDKRAEARVMALVRETLAAMPELSYEIARPAYFSFKTPVEVEIYGDDMEELQRASQRLAADMAALPDFRDVASSLKEGAPEIHVVFNRAALLQYGLDLFQVSNLLKNKIRGEVATALRQNERDIDVRVRNDEKTRSRVADIGNLVVGQRDGVPIVLQSVADLRVGRGPSEIRRLDQRRCAVVSANLEGSNLDAAARALAPVLRRFNASDGGMTAALSGQNRERMESFRSLLFAILLAVFLVYIVMASEFESFLHPFVILLTVPLGLVGVAAALLLTHTAVDVMVLIGIVILAGIVVNNAIVLVDYTNQLRAQGTPRREALRQAGRVRLRPILMTTGTTVLGLLPMALGLGEGSELRSPLAITVIGGLTGATLLTLVVIPVVYELLDRGPAGPASAP